MPTIEEQLALRNRLQTAEDDLVAARQQHVTTDGTLGIITWQRQGAPRYRAEPVVIDDIQEIEDMIVSQQWDDIILATDRGTWTWRPH
jgi:hypothetical protein